MPTTFQRCDKSVDKLAQEILEQFETHHPLIDAGVKIDFVFAYADAENGGDALKWQGVKALGVCRKIGLKDRALGRADAEIALDHEWWDDADEADQRALLDHELHHIEVQHGKTDDLGRPLLKLRRHDVTVGWFRAVAARHGSRSMERQQAAKLFEDQGQYFWPQLAGEVAKAELPGGTAVTIRTGDETVTIAAGAIRRGVKRAKRAEAAAATSNCDAGCQ